MSIEHYPKPEVGMAIFVVPAGNHRGKPYTVTITKIGRKWAELGLYNYRMDMTTWRLDGGGYLSPGTCYPSEQTYIEEVELSRMWDSFVSNLSRWYPPSSVTVEAIKQAEKLLGLES